jgi:dTMP kinase
MDRYYPSGIVFSAAKQDPSLSIPWCRAPDVGLPAPDLAIFLNLSPEAAAARGGGYGEEKYETRQIQDRARELFGKVIEDEKAVGMEHWQVVDAGKTVEEVQTELLKLADQVIQEAAKGDRASVDRVKAL